MEPTASAAFTQPQTCDTRFGEALCRRTAAHPQQSGIYTLSLAEDAFAARIVLARAAQRSLDLQYYIWHADTTGQLLWEERLTGTGARNASWSAPVLAGDRLYVANQNADVFVLRASPKFECVATNSIGGEPMNASLAISDGHIFIRTDKQLWCIGENKE